MRTFVNFTLAILLLIAFIGSGAFFVIISKDLKLERNTTAAAAATTPSSATPSSENETPTEE